MLRGLKIDDTMHVALQMVALTYFVGFGLQEATSSLVGAQIGGKRMRIAEESARVSILFAFALSLVLAAVITVSMKNVAGYFSTDENAISHAVDLLPILCMIAIVNSCLGGLMGVVRALGLQLYGYLLSLFCFCLVSTPLAYYWGDDILGGFMGMLYGSTALVLALTAMLIRMDWGSSSDEAEETLFGERNEQAEGAEDYLYSKAHNCDKLIDYSQKGQKVRSRFGDYETAETSRTGETMGLLSESGRGSSVPYTPRRGIKSSPFSTPAKY